MLDERERPIEKVLDDHSGELIAVPGVLGTAIGLSRGEPCIVVFAQDHQVAAAQSIPESIEGYPVRIRVSGRMDAL